MPENRCNQRVKVSFNEDTSHVIRRLSDLTGESMSSIVSTMVEPHVFHLAEIADLLEQAQEKRKELAARETLTFEGALAYFEDIVQNKVEQEERIQQVKMESEAEQRAKILAAVGADNFCTGNVVDFPFPNECCDGEPPMGYYDPSCDEDFHSSPVDADGVPL